MSMTLTPGPWEVLFLGDEPFVRSMTHWVKNDRGPDYLREILSDEEYPEKEADARAIAKVPEMVGVLRFYENCWQRNVHEMSNGRVSEWLSPGGALLDDKGTKARAILAAIEGEQGK